MSPDLSTPFYLSYAALWVLVVLHSLLLLGLVRIVYQLQQTGAAAGSSPLQSGQDAPKFSAIGLSGAPISSAEFAGRVVALLFVSPSCSTCMTTLSELDALNHKVKGNVVVICKAGREDCAALANTYELNIPIVADGDERLSRLFNISAVPTAVIIANNRIQSHGQPLRGEELEQIFQKAPEAEVEVMG